MVRLIFLLILLAASVASAQYDPLDDYYEVLSQNSFGVASKCATRVARAVELVPAEPRRTTEPYYDTSSIKYCFASFDNAGRLYYDSCGGKEPKIDRYRYDGKGRLVEHLHDYHWIDFDSSGISKPERLKQKWRRYRRFPEDAGRVAGKDLHRYRIRARYTYDARDSLVKVEKWSSGQIMEILYLTRDNRGRLKRTHYTDVHDYDKRVDYSYDKRGRLRAALDDRPMVGDYERRKYHWDGDTLRMVTYSGFHVDTLRLRYMNEGLVTLSYLIPSDSLRSLLSNWIVRDTQNRVLSAESYHADPWDGISNVLDVADWRKKGWMVWSNTFWLDEQGRLEDRMQNEQDNYTVTHYEYLDPDETKKRR